LIRRTDAISDWIVIDTARDPNNVTERWLFPNDSIAEVTGSARYMDILSNGFKARGTGTGINGSGATYIYAAFAEVPFKSALGR
jgi:hypothetical protein